MGTPWALVGRERAQSALRDAVRTASAGQGSLVLITGEAGIGKTALVTDLFTELAPELMATVVWGRSVEGLGAPAYWMWTQVLRQLGVLVEDRHLGEAGDLGVATGGDRFGLFEDVVAALDAAGRCGGLLVVLDDLHWADPDSLALLELVVRSLDGRPVMVLGTYRDTESVPGVQRLVGRAQVVALDGLSPAATAQLIGHLTSTEVGLDEATRMQQRTGGNPFFVRELTRLDRLRTESARPSAVEIVASVRDVVERRLARLSQQCVRLLTTAALDGALVRPWVLRAVHGDVDVGGLLEEAVGQRVLSEDSGDLRFAHDLFREVIETGLGPSTRRTSLLALGRARAAGRDAGQLVHASELAYLYARAAAPGDPDTLDAALGYAREAARVSASRFAFEDAAAHLERALDVLDTTGGRPDLRLALMLEVAASQHVAGRPQDAAASFRAALAIAGQVGDPVGHARAALGLHRVGVKTGPSAERDAQSALLEAAAAQVDGVDPVLACEVRAALALALHHSVEARRMVRAREIATVNVTRARTLGEPTALAAALRALHDTTWQPGTARDRLELLDELDRGPGSDDQELALLRAQALLELGDPASRAIVAQVCDEAELTVRLGPLWLATSRRAALALLAGRLEEAERCILSAGRLADQLGDDDARWVTDIQRWELARFTGGRGGFVRHLPDGEPRVERWPPWRSLVLAESGRTEEAVAILEGFGAAEAHGPGVNAGYDLWFPAIAAEAAARNGSDRLQGELYEMLAPYSGTQVGCGAWVAYSGPVDGYLADLAFARGDAATGATHLRSAEQQCLRLSAPLWLARIRDIPRHHGAGRLAVNTFARHGPAWAVTFDQVEATVRDAAGMQVIATLLTRPHRSFSAAELAGSVAPDRGEPVLDRRAVASYRARIRDLEDEIESADSNHDLDRAAKARVETDALLDELRRATGHHGRSRRLGDDSERVRKMIRARVHRAILLIAERHPQLAAHLRDSVDTGSSCTYRPAEPLVWTVAP